MVSLVPVVQIEVKSGGAWRTDAEGSARIGPLPAGDYEASLIADFQELLPEVPPWNR